MTCPYIPIEGCAYRLALADVDGDGANELVYGAWDSAVACIRPNTGEQLWRTDIGGFPFAVSARDIDGNGRAELLVACADSRAYLLDSGGRVMWTYDTGRPVYAVAAGHLCAGDPMYIVCAGVDRRVTVLDTAGRALASHEVAIIANRMTLADVDGDGRDEIFVVDNRETAELLSFDGEAIEQRWRKRLTVPDDLRNWENPRASFFVFAVDACDLNGDGKAELVLGDAYFNKQTVLAIDGEGEPLWLTDSPGPCGDSDTTWYEFYSTAFVRGVPQLPGTDGPGLVTVTGGHVRLFDAAGQLLGEAHAPVGFADLVVDGSTLYLGSTPNGDRTIYRVDLAGDWPSQIASLERTGLFAEVATNLDAVRRQVEAQPARQHTPTTHHHVRMFHVRGNAEALARTSQQMDRFRRTFPYDHLVPTAGAGALEPTPPLNRDGEPWNAQRWQTDSIRGTMPVERIIDLARAIEQHRIPTLINMGHSCMPFIQLSTAEAMLEAAPNAIIGFLSAEDEDPALVPRFAREYLAPLGALCKRYGGKQCITKNKNVWWMSMPARTDVSEALFSEPMRGITAASTEDSNSRTPEINLMARAGLRQAGLIDRFWIGAIGDLFSYCRFHQWEYPRTGSPYLRLLVAHTVMGGTDYELRVAGMRTDGDKVAFNRLGREHVEMFLHMLGKGLVFTPRREQIVGLNPVGFAVHQPPDDWVFDGHNGHRPHRWPDTPAMREAMIPLNSCTWGNAPTPPHALQAVLLNKRRQFGYHVPPTPYGPFVFVPATADLHAVSGVDQWIHTDGVDVWQADGPRLRGEAGAAMIRDVFEAGAARLAFRPFGDDVFCQTLEVDPGRYRIYLIDPGWMDPADRDVRLAVQVAGIAEVRDVLSDEALPITGGAVGLTVPAGSLRVLEAT